MSEGLVAFIEETSREIKALQERVEALEEKRRESEDGVNLYELCCGLEGRIEALEQKGER